ncbi:hypothetical protein [Poriferisphaera sp. WC338]|uniref:hypothetical protein n=1 Tax=Poriferisphaera sp. WC338 TaxID=3425129 RepID=UPI003D817170
MSSSQPEDVPNSAEGAGRDRYSRMTGETCPQCLGKTAMHTKKQYNKNHPLGVRECSGCGLIWAPRLNCLGKMWIAIGVSLLLFVVLMIVDSSWFYTTLSVTYLLSLPFVVVALLVLWWLNPDPVESDPAWIEKCRSKIRD